MSCSVPDILYSGENLMFPNRKRDGNQESGVVSLSRKEWAETAEIIVEDCLGIQQNEKILIVVGEGIEKTGEIDDLYEALIEELFRRERNPAVISYRAGAGREPPALVEEACCSADVIVTINVHGFLHSGAFPRIRKRKKPEARILMLPDGNDADFVNRMVPKTREAFYEVAEISGKVGGKFLGGPHRVRLTAPNGTDLTFTIGQLQGWCHTGIARESGFALIPAGTLNVGVDEGSAEGILVIDTFTALKEDLLDGRIVFEIRNGSAVSVTGGPEAEDFVQASEGYPGTWAEKFCVAEFGLGFVRNADYRVNLSEGEHVYAAAHIGIGSNATFGGGVMIPGWHSDSLLPGASVELDGRLIAENGEYLV